MHYIDRTDAGKQLARALSDYSSRPDTVVIGLPRGGVITAAPIAQALQLPLDIIVVRKIGYPHSPENAIGAVSETGDVLWNEAERALIDDVELAAIVQRERAEAERRLKRYRANLPPRDLVGKTVIVVDDGLATGFSMEAAVRVAYAEGAARIVLAVPHGASDTIARLRPLVAGVVALDQPTPYGAVGQYYMSFPQTTDEEVVAALTTS